MRPNKSNSQAILAPANTPSCWLSNKVVLAICGGRPAAESPIGLSAEVRTELTSLRADVSNDFFDGGDYTAQDVLNLLGSGGWKGGRMDDDMSHRFGMNSRY
ncbi:DUF6559 family protein [Vibrio sp. M260121]|uniref:DUF6559 family protein n=1 Tax=Vibrio sp. M260121 TaxID=3020897 RepID=UPI002F409C9B